MCEKKKMLGEEFERDDRVVGSNKGFVKEGSQTLHALARRLGLKTEGRALCKCQSERQ